MDSTGAPSFTNTSTEQVSTNMCRRRLRQSPGTTAREQGDGATFRGYPPTPGYTFLKERIIRQDFAPYGVNLSQDEVFVNDGAPVLSMLNYPKDEARGISFAGDFTIDSLRKWEMI